VSCVRAKNAQFALIKKIKAAQSTRRREMPGKAGKAAKQRQ